MKEILTKKFWQDVKKTFDEAREDTPQTSGAPQVTPEENADNSSPEAPLEENAPGNGEEKAQGISMIP